MKHAIALIVLAAVVSGCGALENLLGINERQAAPDCQEVRTHATADSTLPPSVRQLYPEVYLVLSSCPTSD